MPREAARIFLRVKGVGVERLQKIDVLGMQAEGIKPGRQEEWPDGLCVNRNAYAYMYYANQFATLWDQTIKPKERSLYGWAADPWVWVIQFERAEEIGP